MLSEKLIRVEFMLRQVQSGQAVAANTSFIVSWYKEQIRNMSEKDANELLNILIEMLEIIRKYFIEDGKFKKPSVIRYWALASDLVRWLSNFVAYL